MTAGEVKMNGGCPLSHHCLSWQRYVYTGEGPHKSLPVSTFCLSALPWAGDGVGAQNCSAMRSLQAG